MIQRTLRIVLWPFRRLLAVAALPVLVVLVDLERRRPRPSVPRILWGPEPSPAHAEAVRRLGYTAATVAETGGYRRFAWALRRFDIFVFSPQSTILRGTPLKYWELQLLRFAGKKLVLLPRGSDVRMATRTRNLLFKHAQSLDDPKYTRGERQRLRDLEYCAIRADHIMSAGDLVDYLPWWDRLSAGYAAVDVEEWKPDPRTPGHPLVVVHAPSDRELAGTAFLVRACDELARDGLAVELHVVERGDDEALRERMQEADVVADQFVLGWYGLVALEGMSMAKPVLSFLRPDLLELYTLFSFAGECPIVNTAPFDIKEKLRELAADPERAAELGRRGRQYVRDHHSVEALTTTFDEIVTALWPRQEAA